MTDRIRRLRWAQRAGKLLVEAGFYGAGALTCAAAVVTWQNSKHLGTGDMLLAVAVQAMPIVIVGSVLLYLGRTVHLWCGRRLLAADRRPSVLYLRSFEADQVPRPDFSPGRSTHGYPVAFEEEIAEVLWEVGPPETVAAPGAWQTPLGFVRTPLEDGEWEPQVRRRMEDAALVVILIGETPGLLWEVGEAFRVVRPERLLLAMLPGPTDDEEGRRAVYVKFRNLVAEIADLPASLAKGTFIGFDAKGMPKVLRPHRRVWYGEGRHRFTRTAVRETLRGVCSHLGVELASWPTRLAAIWRRARQAAAVGFIAWIAWLIFHGNDGEVDPEQVYLRTMARLFPESSRPPGMSDRMLVEQGRAACASLQVAPLDEARRERSRALRHALVPASMLETVTEATFEAGVPAFCPELASKLFPTRSRVELLEALPVAIATVAGAGSDAAAQAGRLEPETLLALSESVCRELGADRSLKAIVKELVAALSKSVEDSRVARELGTSIFGASVQLVCPEHVSRIMGRAR